MDTMTHHGPTHPTTGIKQPYHLVNPSPWPIVGAFGGGLLPAGVVFAAHYGNYLMVIAGLAAVILTMVMWWRDVLKESATPGLHSPVVRLGLRYGVTLFITSEVMFFVGFFWAFFHFFLYPEHVSGAVQAIWPPEGTVTFNPMKIPLLNTMILLLSGCTVTWAHHCLIEGDNKGTVQGLAVTALLGLAFLCGQAWEYTHSPFNFYHGGIFASSFFIATGFHGFHVIVGTAFLFVCLFRAMAGQFNPQRHFGFEAAAWYWHFVDVVWLFLFVCIYFLGRSAIVAG